MRPRLPPDEPTTKTADVAMCADEATKKPAGGGGSWGDVPQAPARRGEEDDDRRWPAGGGGRWGDVPQAPARRGVAR